MYLDKVPCQLKENTGSRVTIGTLLSRDSVTMVTKVLPVAYRDSFKIHARNLSYSREGVITAVVEILEVTPVLPNLTDSYGDILLLASASLFH